MNKIDIKQLKNICHLSRLMLETYYDNSFINELDKIIEKFSYMHDTLNISEKHNNIKKNFFYILRNDEHILKDNKKISILYTVPRIIKK